MAKIKNKKSKLADVYAKKRKQQQAKKTITPFEIHVNKDKRKVLGQKSKSDRGLPGISRTKAIAKRKGTLLQEYKFKDKDNILLDKRLHQKNPNMSEEEKALARFAKERMKAQKKKNIFNLNDDEILTHKGQAIMDIEKFDNPNSDDDEFSDGDDENREGRLGKKFLEEAHFGGGLLSNVSNEKSRKSVIEELIADSKRRRDERIKKQEKIEDLTKKLDTDWKDLLPIITNTNKSLDPVEEKPKADDYDITMRQLKFEIRGNPTDKLKSEEQIAEEERVSLEKLEQDRLERMNGFVKDDLYRKHRSADDLDDGFVAEDINDEDDKQDEDSGSKDSESDEESEDEEEEDNENEEEQEGEEDNENEDEEEQEKGEKVLGKKCTKIDNKIEEDEDNEQEENDDDDDEEEEKSNKREQSLNDNSNEQTENNSSSESEDEDNLSDLKVSESSSDDDEEEEEERRPIKKTSKLKSKNISENSKTLRENEESISEGEKMLENARAELPHTYKVPETYEDLNKLLRGHNEHYQSVIIERIIKCNHWSLGVKGNREKLSSLYEHLLMYIDCFDLSSEESILKSFQILDRLCPHLYDLAHASAENAKKCLQEIIQTKHNEFEEKKKKYVGSNLLMFLKLVSLIFPTSDFRHPVVSPCLVFMSQILSRCSVKRKSHISKGLYICTLILEYTTLSKRFSPEAINFLRGLIYLSMPKSQDNKSIKVIPPFKSDGDFSKLLQIDENMKNHKIDLSKPQMKTSDLIEDEIDSDFKIRVFATTINLICEFKKQYEELEAVYSMFEPILKMLKCNFMKKYPKNLRQRVNELIEELEVLKEKKLEFLVREKKKPKALRLYEPRIERVYEGRRHKKMSQEKAEREKMVHKIKREMKGAIREVRRDTSFLANLKIKEQIKSDMERKRKVKEIFGDAAVQQSEFNKMKRKK